MRTDVEFVQGGAVAAPATRFAVLGPLEVWRGGERVAVPAGRVRVLLATLLLRANRTVSVDDLVERLWDDVPNPRRVRATLQMVVTRLRQALGDANVVRTRTNGYLADVPPGALDLHRFRDLADRGRHAEALELWRGAPLSDVRSDALHREDVAPLLEEHLVVLERRIDADLAAGRAGALVAQLRGLTERHPLRERFWGQLMLALYRSERQAEALAAFRAVRAALVEELGVEPGPALTDLYDRILRNDVPGGPVTLTARQVPPAGSVFVGREPELAALDEAVREPGAVVLLHGAGGVGKTALAVRWANRRRDRFPDGDLHLDLRGFDAAGRPVEPARAVEALLVSAGVRPQDVPAGLDARAALFREVVAGRRMLLVLDNAAGSDQVTPLLPGTPTVVVLVTSRDQLRGLAARRGVRRVPLRPLSADRSLELLSSVLGRERVEADPVASARVVARCAGLPLALRVFAERVARFPGTPMGAFAAELADERSRLDHLSAEDGDDTDVRSVFSWSYRALPRDAARLFRLLPAHPGPDLGVPAAAALADVPERDARRWLERLAAGHLLESRAPGRYEWHDLLRAYADDLADPADDRPAAVRRLVGWYVAATEAAAARTPSYRSGTCAELPAGAAAFPLGAADPGAWGRRELPNLVAVVRVAAEHGWHDEASRIGAAVWWLLDSLPEVDSLVEVFRIGRDSARAAPAPHRLGAAINHLAWSCARAGRPEAALETYLEGLAVAVRDGDRRLEGAIALNTGGTYQRLGRHGEAVEQLRRGLRIAEEEGDDHHRAAAHFTLSLSLGGLHRYEEALEHGLRARAVFDGSGDEYHSARSTFVVARAHRALGRFAEAESALREGIAVLAGFAQPAAQSHLFDELGTVLLCLDRREEALECWRRALALYDEYERGPASVLRSWLADYDALPTPRVPHRTGAP
ncbi:BTAD domain-containing putative transcriptional regulator [Actinosynnema sp. NPDC004786]